VPSSFFYAPINLPSAQTLPATAVTSTGATLNGSGNDGGQGAAGLGNSSYHFVWGTSPSSLSNSTSSTSFSGLLAATANLSGLTSGDRYYFALVVENSIATSQGGTVAFETTTNLPTLLSPLGNLVGPGPVTLSWQYNSGGATGGQTAFAIEITGSIPGLGSGTFYWNAGTESWQSAVVWNSSSESSAVIPASALTPNSSFTWSVATEDANGESGFA
jgi:hypothetical protein